MPRAMSWRHSVMVDGIVYMTSGEYMAVVSYTDMTHKRNSGLNYLYINYASLL